MQTRTRLKASEDSQNSYPGFFDFTVTNDSVAINIDDRELTFRLKDFQALIRLAEALQDDGDSE